MVVASFAAVVFAASVPVLVLDTERATYLEALNRVAIQAEAQFAGQPCPTAKAEPISREDVKIGDRPELAAARERVRVTGCGRSSVENINVARLGGSPPWKMNYGLPGGSLADMNLQNSAWPQVLSQAAANLPADCKSVTIRDIYVSARPGSIAFENLAGSAKLQRPRLKISLPAETLGQQANLNAEKAWAEVWPTALCGTDRTVVVVFIPLRDRPASQILVLPVWPQIEQRGAGAMPVPDS
jgi:hypothetical protein